MKVSVVIAAYNIEEYIERCLFSVINQTLKDIEIIVVNDGSKDGTLKKIEEIKSNDSRVKIIDQKNKGLVEARKSGLQLATSEYILFIDGDDWLELNCLELLYDKACSTNSDIVIYDAYQSYDDKRVAISTVSDDNLSNNWIENLFLGKVLPCIWSKFIRLEFIKMNCIQFPDNLSFAEDLALVSSLFLNNPKVNVLKQNLYNYYQRHDSITNKRSRKVLEINKAFSFVENQLTIKRVFDKYKKEFEYMIFMHMFDHWFLGEYVYDTDIGSILYNQYRSRKININNNHFILNQINSYKYGLRFRIRCYNKSYMVGKFYDSIRSEK